MTTERPEHNIGENIFLIAKRLKQRLGQILTEYQGDRKQFFDVIHDTVDNAFSDESEALKTILLDSASGTDEEFIDRLSQRLATYFGSKYTPQELEQKLKSENETTRGYENANELLMYKINENSISLHIPMQFNTEMGARAKILEGLKNLALTIKSRNLQNLKEVSGTSWIIYQHPELIKKLGFNIVNIDDTRKVARATISIERFLQIYG